MLRYRSFQHLSARYKVVNQDQDTIVVVGQAKQNLKRLKATPGKHRLQLGGEWWRWEAFDFSDNPILAMRTLGRRRNKKDFILFLIQPLTLITLHHRFSWLRWNILWPFSCSYESHSTNNCHNARTVTFECGIPSCSFHVQVVVCSGIEYLTRVSWLVRQLT